MDSLKLLSNAATIQKSTCDYKLLASTLNNFIASYSGATSFVPLILSLDEKKAVIHLILSYLKEKALLWSPDDQANAFQSLKILSRERTGIEEIQSKETIALCLKYGGCIKEGDSNNLKPVVQYEALKLLINAIHGTPGVQSILLDQNGLTLILHKIQNSLNDDLILFLCLRIIFLMTVSNPAVSRTFWKDIKGLPIIIEVGKKLAKSVTEKDSQKATTLAEVYKTAFVFWKNEENNEQGLDLSPVAELYNSLHSSAIHLIKTKSEVQSPLYDAQIQAINLFLMAPDNSFPNLFASKDKGLVAKLLLFLDTQISNANAEFMAEDVFPLLGVLTKMASEEKWVRRYMKSKILPLPIDRFVRPEVGNSLKAKIIRIMTSPKTPLNVAAGNFLFTLCKRNGKKFTRHVGWGNGIGVLGQLNIFHQNSPIVDTESENDVDGDDDFDPVTGARATDNAVSPISQMSEDEKEAEAERLVHLFDRLNRTGVIQVMAQDENGNQVPFNPLQDQQNDS